MNVFRYWLSTLKRKLTFDLNEKPTGWFYITVVVKGDSEQLVAYHNKVG